MRSRLNKVGYRPALQKLNAKQGQAIYVKKKRKKAI